MSAPARDKGSSDLPPSPSPELDGTAGQNARGEVSPTVRGQQPPNAQRVSTAELVDFIGEQARRRSVKEVAKLTGLSLKAVENIRQGEAGASAQTISTWCRNDPQFRAEYFFWCGGYVESDPEFIAGITMAMNSLMRRKE